MTVSYQAQAPVLERRVAVEFTRRAHVVAAGDSAAIGIGAQAGSAGAVDTVSHDGGVHRGGDSQGSVCTLSGRPGSGCCRAGGGERAMIFGGTATVEQYKGNPRVQAHGPGFSKILLGDDVVDHWPKYLDLMVESIYINSGRGCINCSGVWASRHTKEIAQAIAERIGPIEVKPPTDPQAGLAAFTVPGQAKGVWNMIEADLKESGVTDMTAKYGPRLVEKERCAYLRPMIVHCASPDKEIAKKEYMFPFSTVVECPQDQMLAKIGPTLVCSAITEQRKADQRLDRRDAHRPLEPGPDSHHAAQLAAAARGKYHRLPVSQSSVAGGNPRVCFPATAETAINCGNRRRRCDGGSRRLSDSIVRIAYRQPAEVVDGLGELLGRLVSPTASEAIVLQAFAGEPKSVMVAIGSNHRSGGGLAACRRGSHVTEVADHFQDLAARRETSARWSACRRPARA